MGGMPHKLAAAILVAALTVACSDSPEAAAPATADPTSADQTSGPATDSESAGTSAATSPASTASSPTESSSPPTSPNPPSSRDAVSARVRAMTVRDRARQLLVVAFSGTTAPSQLIETLRPGGLIYFEPNVASTDQIREMSAEAQRLARAGGEPLLIMTDQEGGLVTRLPGTSDVPAGAEFGGDAQLARRTASSTGRALDDVGINVDLAPVADVNTVGLGGVIGSRSFSTDPDVAAKLVRAQVCGYHEGGVAAAAKHFPGHGSTSTDSHLSTAVIHASLPGWRQTDLPPFARAVESRVDLILTGHLAFPALDPSGRPATISPRLTQQLLRDRLGFDGVIITDALNMGGITSWGSSRSIAVRAIKSGVDMLLMPPQPREAVRGIVEAVRDGRITTRRLNESVGRVLRLKQQLGLYQAAKQLPTC